MTQLFLLLTSSGMRELGTDRSDLWIQNIVYLLENGRCQREVRLLRPVFQFACCVVSQFHYPYLMFHFKLIYMFVFYSVSLNSVKMFACSISSFYIWRCALRSFLNSTYPQSAVSYLQKKPLGSLTLFLRYLLTTSKHCRRFCVLISLIPIRTTFHFFQQIPLAFIFPILALTKSLIAQFIQC